MKNINGDYYLISAFGIETLLSAVFVFTVLGVTSQEKSERRAGLIIGLALTLVHIFGIPFTGTSVNPARSLAPAIFAYLYDSNSEPLNELWIYICGPFLGAIIAAFLYWLITFTKNKEENKEEVVSEEKPVVEEKVVQPVEETPVVKQEVKAEEEKLEIQRVSFETKLKKANKSYNKK